MNGRLRSALCVVLFSGNLHAQGFFWQQASGPYGGDVYAVIIDSTGLVLAGAGAGIFRSTDFGTTWNRVSSQSMEWGGFALSYGTTAYAGTQNGVFRSRDRGTSWTRIGVAGPVYTVTVNASGSIFAGQPYNGVVRSTDQGITWEQSGFYTRSARVLLTTPGGRIFAGITGLGVVRSGNDGASWDTVNAGLTGGFVRSLCFVPPGLILCGNEDGVFTSTNWGDSWSRIYAGHEVIGMIAQSEQSLVVCTNGYGLWRTTDGGLVWHPVSQVDQDMLVLGGNRQQHIFGGSRQFGVFRSPDDGITWEQVGIPATNITSIVSAPGGHFFAGGVQSDGTLYESSDGTESWTTISDRIPTPGLRGAVHLCAAPGGALFLTSNEAGIFRSTDNGTSWTRCTTGLSGLYAYSVATSPNGHVFAGTGSGVYKSTDNGTSWVPTTLRLYTVSFHAPASGTIYACTPGFGFWRSRDDGSTWGGLGAGITSFDVRTVVTNSSGHIFAGTSDNVMPPEWARGGIFRSTNDGLSWEHTSSGLPHVGDNYVDISHLVVNASQTIFAATNDGLYASTNNGDSWSPLDSGLASRNIHTVHVDPREYLFAGTQSNGVYRTSRATVGVSPFDNDVAYGFQLGQNYPNPFNPATTIDFQIPAPSFVTLKVFDVVGREVATIVSETLPAGSYTHHWDAETFPSGVYFYRLRAGSFVETRKLLLLR